MYKVAACAFILAMWGCSGSSAPVATPCPAAPPPISTPSALVLSGTGKAVVSGMVTCDYANGTASNCNLNTGATMDEFVNATLKGESLSMQ